LEPGRSGEVEDVDLSRPLDAELGGLTRLADRDAIERVARRLLRDRRGRVLGLLEEHGRHELDRLVLVGFFEGHGQRVIDERRLGDPDLKLHQLLGRDRRGRREREQQRLLLGSGRSVVVGAGGDARQKGHDPHQRPEPHDPPPFVT
jgi:hypothetical protein